MEILDYDIKNLKEFLHTSVELAIHYNKYSDDHDDKSFAQPIFFKKPTRYQKWALILPGNSKFFSINQSIERGEYDTDLIWYNTYILNEQKPLVTHHPLDWQLIALGKGEDAVEDKIYVNINLDSQMYGMFVYASGGPEPDQYNYFIIAINNEQFFNFWLEVNNKSVTDVIKQFCSPSPLDNYYSCSTSECTEKKKLICQKLQTKIEYNPEIKFIVRECGTCYWLMITGKTGIIRAGDLFFDRITQKFISVGKNEDFATWHSSFNTLYNYLNNHI